MAVSIKVLSIKKQVVLETYKGCKGEGGGRWVGENTAGAIRLVRELINVYDAPGNTTYKQAKNITLKIRSK